jgi:hypothetical protein
MKKSNEKRNSTIMESREKAKELSSEKGKASIRKSPNSKQLQGYDVNTANRILFYLQEQEKF